MEQRLIEAAQAGDTNALYALIRENPYLLKIVDETPFVDTPLHIAATLGHMNFAVEVASLWQSFGKKLNPDGHSAIHLAMLNGHTETVKRLISIDSELIRVRGKEGSTPLHCAAEMGNVDLLAELLCACPKSIEDLNIRCESALHVSVRKKELGAIKVMLGWICKTGRGKVLLNSADDNGDTLLHIAASMNQPQVVKLLLDHKVNMNAKNSEGLTSLDIVLGLSSEETEDSSEILAILNRKRAQRGSSIPTFQSLSGFLSSKVSFVDKLHFRLGDFRRDLSTERRNLVLVVAVLIATATYQSALTPPGGFFQADATTTAHMDRPQPTPLAAKSVMQAWAFDYFMLLNTLSFGASILVMLLVLEFRDYTAMLHGPLICLIISYGVLLIVAAPPTTGCWILGICLCVVLYGALCVLMSPIYKSASGHHHRQMRRV